MRADRLITLGVVGPCRQAGRWLRARAPAPWAPRAGLPVLMYHSISDDPEAGVGPYYRVCTPPRRFAEHMRWLADWGYRGVTLSEGLAAMREQGAGNPEPRAGTAGPTTRGQGGAHVFPPPSGRLVALTFDDGFRDFSTAAFPVLQQHGFLATMYLPTASIADDRRIFKDRECLTWAETRELGSAGVEFGSHTVSHPKLVELTWPQIEAEVTSSKLQIEDRLGRPVSTFAYPYAFPQADRSFVRGLRRLLGDAGYLSAVTTEIGRVQAGDDPFCLKRLPANGADDAPLLAAKLAGAYDWLAGPQLLRKNLQRWLVPGARRSGAAAGAAG